MGKNSTKVLLHTDRQRATIRRLGIESKKRKGIMTGKAVKWSHDHTDKYVYRDGVWIKAVCGLPHGKICVSDNTYERGQLPTGAYNTRLTEVEEVALEMRFEA